MRLSSPIRSITDGARSLRPLVKEMWRNGRLNGLFAGMRCDGGLARCKETPRFAPMVYVPSHTPLYDGHDELRMMTTLHYCQAHVGELRLDDFLTLEIRIRFQQSAKLKRPIEFKCNFEAAHLVYVDVGSPLYRSYLAAIEVLP